MEPKELAPVLQAVEANDGRCGRSMIAKILRGSRDKRLLALGLDQCSEYGTLAAQTLEQIGYFIWDQRTNRVVEIEAEPAWRVANFETWFERRLRELGERRL